MPHALEGVQVGTVGRQEVQGEAFRRGLPPGAGPARGRGCSKTGQRVSAAIPMRQAEPYCGKCASSPAHRSMVGSAASCGSFFVCRLPCGVGVSKPGTGLAQAETSLPEQPLARTPRRIGKRRALHAPRVLPSHSVPFPPQSRGVWRNAPSTSSHCTSRRRRARPCLRGAGQHPIRIAYTCAITYVVEYRS